MADVSAALAAVPKQLLIGGAWVDSRSGATLPVEDPATGSVLTTVADATPDDALAALKPLLEEPGVAEVLAWTGRLCAAKGWAYEVWSGADPVLLRNVRFLSTARRSVLVDETAVVKLAQHHRPGMTLGEVEASVEADAATARGAALALLWRGRWLTDLTQPLSSRSVLQAVAT